MGSLAREVREPQLAYDNGRIFTTLLQTGTAGAEVNAYDATIGALDWTDTPSQEALPLAPVAMNGVLYVDAADGAGNNPAFGFNEFTGAVVQSATFNSGDVVLAGCQQLGVFPLG